MRVRTITQSRTVLVLAIVLILAVVAIAIILVQPVEVPVEAPSAPHEGEITILENGDAQMKLTTTATIPQVDNLYKTALENLGETEFKTMFHQDIENEYEILTGLDISISDSEIGTGPNGEFTISVNATASQVGVYNPTKNLWEVDIRPREENAEGAEYMLTQMMFAQMLLKTQLKEPQLELESSLPIRLPSNSTIMNKDNLSASKWKIEFGGGMYREASLSVNEGQREVVLTERIVVTDQAPELTQEAYDNFHNYRAFLIEYDLPGQVSMSARAAGASSEEKSGDCKNDWSRSWHRTFSYTFTENFTGETDSVTANLDVYANPSFGFTFYIGWDFEWEWDWPPLQLQWFRTYVEFSPGLVLDVDADITGNFSDTWVKDIYSWSRWVTVSIAGFPVSIELRVDLDAGAEASAQGDFHFDAALDAETSLKLGVEYDGSWGPIYDWDENILYSGPNIDVGAAATIKPYVELKVGAYVYGTAGPFVFLKPSATATLTAGDTNTWSIDAGFDFGAGVGFGELGDWLPLSDWRTTIDNWSTNLASGTWRQNNTPPTLTLENAPPTEGSIGTTYTYEVTYTDADGDAPAYIRCYIDGEAKNMSYVSGDYATGARYRYTWATTTADIGSHNYRFEAQDGQATAKLPSSGTYSGPSLSLPWKAVSAGYRHSLGLSTDGSLWAWGYNYDSQLGLGSAAWEDWPYDYPNPTRVGSSTSWTAISAGYNHSLGLKSNGTLWAWGSNYAGKLGLGDNSIYYKTSPVQVGTATNWTAISTGYEHSLGLRSDGTLWAWGWNEYGQLGLGDTDNRWSPTQVGTVTNWTAISAGWHYSLAIRSDGTLWAWGTNLFGELGLGDTTNRTSPVQVGTATNWTAISANLHSLGLRSDGTLWAWGPNGFGQLGLGDTTDRWSPYQVGTATNWENISAGNSHSLGLKSDGSLWAWGYNYYGELGLGDTTDRWSPTRVGTETYWVTTSAGSSYSLAITSGETLWAWGLNLDGQLGLGDITNRTSPDRIGG